MNEFDPKVKENLAEQVKAIAEEQKVVIDHPVIEQPVVQQPQVVASPPQYVPVNSVVNKNEKAGVEPILVIGIVALLLTILFMSANAGIFQGKFSSLDKENSIEYVDENSYVENSYIDPTINNYPQYTDTVMQDDLLRRVEHLERRADRNDHRIWLLGIANNENSMVAKRLAERNGAADLSKKFVVFNGAWKLNKMPEFFRMNQSERYSLLQEVDDRLYEQRYNLRYNYDTSNYQSLYPVQQSAPTINQCAPKVQCLPHYQPQCRPMFNWGYCR